MLSCFFSLSSLINCHLNDLKFITIHRSRGMSGMETQTPNYFTLKDKKTLSEFIFFHLIIFFKCVNILIFLFCVGYPYNNPVINFHDTLKTKIN